MAEVCYVIATYFGKRRLDNSCRITHPPECLELHLEQLASLKHNLAQIVVVVAESQDLASEVEYVTSLTTKHDFKCPITVEGRPNLGLSYGSFVHAYKTFGERFSHYILIEDDYVFIMDDFDTILVGNIDSRNTCGYLCQLGDINNKSALISNGIVKSRALRTVAGNLHEKWFMKHEDVYNDFYQIDFTMVFHHNGYTVEDFSSSFQSPFMTQGGYVVEYGRGPVLISPVQTMNEYKRNNIALAKSEQNQV